MNDPSKDRIHLFEIDWTETELENAKDSITRGSHWANGPYIAEFESAIETYLDVEHAVVCNSGTSALILALRASGIGPGDEVIVPSFTFIATANAVKAVGAEPVFADIERRRYGLDPSDVDERITTETRAILPVHYAGNPCDIAGLQEVADDHGLTLIEDAAEALGATLDGRNVGTFGDCGILSFCQNKVATTGEGGAVITDNAEIARRASQLRSHGRASAEYFESSSSGRYTSLGYNYRMSDLTASIGVAQMSRIQDIVDRRRAVADAYASALNPIKQIETPSNPVNGRHVFQLYTVTLDAGVDRQAIIEGLDRNDIASKVYFDPVHLSEFYQSQYGYKHDTLPTTEEISSRVLSLPMHSNLTRDTIDTITAALQHVMPSS